MSRTSAHTAIRLPLEIANAVKARAVEERRSVSWVIVECCREVLLGDDADGRAKGTVEEGDARREGDGTAVPILRNAKGGKKRLYPVQSVRRELAQRGNEPSGVSGTRPASSAAGSCPHGKRNEAYCRYIGGGC